MVLESDTVLCADKEAGCHNRPFLAADLAKHECDNGRR